MIIKKEISNRILSISNSRKENKGGIATCVNNLSKYYEKFNYVASTRSKNPIVMLWYFAMCILGLFYFILIRRIRIVHIHGSSYGSFVRKMIIINICRLMKVKTVYHMHGAEFKLFYAKYNRKDIIKKTIDKVDALVVLSKSWKDFFLSVTDEKRIYIVNNMIDKPDFVRSYQQNQSIVRFLFLGRIGERKGIFDLLEVIKEKKDYLNNRFLLYVGGDGETGKLIEFVIKNRLENLVKFEGWVSGEKKIELLSACDVFILPSYNEGLPLAILEAMSYGMPVISTTVGGIPEAVSDKENGFLIEPGNKQQLLESISYFLEHPQEMEKMGCRSLTMIRNFYPENIIPQLNSIYEKLLS
ncbi:MAG: glycosyltransferase family 4 protein [Prevotellaceae bacterium]|nr:glycosyltransferase family 4 protein [Prevotellaceae bacterium]